jgi:putative membrane protein
MTKLLATASVLALLAAPALAQTGTAPGSAASPPASSSMNRSGDASTTRAGDRSAAGKLAKQDRDFARDAAKSGLAEVEEGQMAQQHAQNPEAQAFAKKIVDDHTQANDKLKSIAQQKGIELPAEADKSEKQANQKLAKSKNFDHDYAKAQVKDHEKAIKLFDKEAKNGKDSDLKQYAQQTLPTLQQHLQMSKDLEQKTRKARTETSQAPRTSGTAGSSMAPAAPGAPRTR